MNTSLNQKLIPILAGLLVLQLLIAAGLNLGDSGYEPAAKNIALAEIDPDAIDNIRIDDGKNSVELVRLDDRWQVSELEFPANGANVDKLLGILSSLDMGLPVATTEEAADRFRVTEDNFSRKIVLSQAGDTVVELYIGGAPALRKVHARLAGDNNTHSVEFNPFDALATTDDWIDKQILYRDIADITRAELPIATLVRRDEGLVVEGLKADQQTNAEEAESLLKKVAELQIQSVLGKSVEDLGKAVDTFKLTLKDGQEISYDITKPEDQHYFVLKSSDQPFYFKVGTYKINPILEMEKERLVQAKEVETPKEDPTAVATAKESDSKS